jgi:hypothetical protein
MSRRITDKAGHRWPVTGTSCSVCHMPADRSLSGEPHPSCAPARELDAAELTPLLRMLTTELGATAYRPLDVWRRYGGRLQSDQPVIPAPRPPTSIPAPDKNNPGAVSAARGMEHHEGAVTDVRTQD